MELVDHLDSKTQTLKGHIGRIVEISGGSEYFGLYLVGRLIEEDGDFYIERGGRR